MLSASRSFSVALVALLTTVPGVASAELFRDQMNNGAAWGVNASGSDSAATFNYDYSADGIPEAPNSVGGDDATRGVKLEANIESGSGQFFTLYPTGQSFSGDYQLRFDAWMNWGTGGTTEFLGGGIGYNDTDADLTSGAQAITTGDGGSANDWRALKSGFFVAAEDMTAGTRQGSEPYYADFLPSVNGSVAGSPGFQWVTWEFDVDGSIVDVRIEKPNGDRLLIATLDGSDMSDGSSGFSTSGNLSLFYADFFTSVAEPAGSTFGLIDNVVVRVPEPSTLALCAIGAMGLVVAGRRRQRAAGTKR
ncbi:PEP-CTERM sorting domain-containing protein [Aeoliella sp. ICT_H6.2]|uniref:PEP-CTERM sorting domain-containing protein n=1 Tax=Aeoliella straminimaris TaxID=2954799 RepID=A0A9X2F6A8_9BACT|nr:PEP-CTERM sorting domain-containing protein [Aeoliella straminimaris]MCO6042549.1 PEP-CTERM sorting domain-containing protein [Aeoliella straminimaris]